MVHYKYSVQIKKYERQVLLMSLHKQKMREVWTQHTECVGCFFIEGDKEKSLGDSGLSM